ncbi:MAG: sugar phosphate isomerase/epimerase [Firmicutes bacterium]|nr:sugar phosphate isomerase/epimerase [Bacillota bacterium]
MRLAIISDEISQDIDEVLSVLTQTGLHYLEIRMIEGRNVLDLSDDELRDLQRLLKRSQIEVCAIAAPLFKAPLDEKGDEKSHDMDSAAGPDPFKLAIDSFPGHLELLERAIEIAKRFNTRLIRCFSFMGMKPYDEVFPQIAQRLSVAARRAEDADVILCVENEPSCYAKTSWQVSELLSRIQSKHIGALWDPGNAYCVGEKDLAKGFDNVRERVMHIHLKDILLRDPVLPPVPPPGKDPSGGVAPRGSPEMAPEFTVVGRGVLDYPAQLALWRRSGYTGFLSLEPHLSIGRGSVSGAIQSIRSMQAMLR